MITCTGSRSRCDEGRCYNDRVQKLRATKNKDEAEQLRCQLAERDAVIADQTNELDSMRTQCNQLNRDKNKTTAEISALQMSVH